MTEYKSIVVGAGGSGLLACVVEMEALLKSRGPGKIAWVYQRDPGARHQAFRFSKDNLNDFRRIIGDSKFEKMKKQGTLTLSKVASRDKTETEELYEITIMDVEKVIYATIQGLNKDNPGRIDIFSESKVDSDLILGPDGNLSLTLKTKGDNGNSLSRKINSRTVIDGGGGAWRPKVKNEEGEYVYNPEKTRQFDRKEGYRKDTHATVSFIAERYMKDGKYISINDEAHPLHRNHLKTLKPLKSEQIQKLKLKYGLSWEREIELRAFFSNESIDVDAKTKERIIKYTEEKQQQLVSLDADHEQYYMGFEIPDKWLKEINELKSKIKQEVDVLKKQQLQERINVYEDSIVELSKDLLKYHSENIQEDNKAFSQPANLFKYFVTNGRIRQTNGRPAVTYFENTQGQYEQHSYVTTKEQLRYEKYKKDLDLLKGEIDQCLRKVLKISTLNAADKAFLEKVSDISDKDGKTIYSIKDLGGLDFNSIDRRGLYITKELADKIATYKTKYKEKCDGVLSFEDDENVLRKLFAGQYMKDMPMVMAKQEYKAAAAAISVLKVGQASIDPHYQTARGLMSGFAYVGKYLRNIKKLAANTLESMIRYTESISSTNAEYQRGAMAFDENKYVREVLANIESILPNYNQTLDKLVITKFDEENIHFVDDIDRTSKVLTMKQDYTALLIRDPGNFIRNHKGFKTVDVDDFNKKLYETSLFKHFRETNTSKEQGSDELNTDITGVDAGTHAHKIKIAETITKLEGMSDYDLKEPLLNALIHNLKLQAPTSLNDTLIAKVEEAIGRQQKSTNKLKTAELGSSEYMRLLKDISIGDSTTDELKNINNTLLRELEKYSRAREQDQALVEIKNKLQELQNKAASTLLIKNIQTLELGTVEYDAELERITKELGKTSDDVITEEALSSMKQTLQDKQVYTLEDTSDSRKAQGIGNLNQLIVKVDAAISRQNKPINKLKTEILGSGEYEDLLAMGSNDTIIDDATIDELKNINNTLLRELERYSTIDDQGFYSIINRLQELQNKAASRLLIKNIQELELGTVEYDAELERITKELEKTSDDVITEQALLLIKEKLQEEQGKFTQNIDGNEQKSLSKLQSLIGKVDAAFNRQKNQINKLKEQLNIKEYKEKINTANNQFNAQQASIDEIERMYNTLEVEWKKAKLEGAGEYGKLKKIEIERVQDEILKKVVEEYKNPNHNNTEHLEKVNNILLRAMKNGYGEKEYKNTLEVNQKLIGNKLAKLVVVNRLQYNQRTGDIFPHDHESTLPENLRALSARNFGAEIDVIEKEIDKKNDLARLGEVEEFLTENLDKNILEISNLKKEMGKLGYKLEYREKMQLHVCKLNSDRESDAFAVDSLASLLPKNPIQLLGYRVFNKSEYTKYKVKNLIRNFQGPYNSLDDALTDKESQSILLNKCLTKVKERRSELSPGSSEKRLSEINGVDKLERLNQLYKVNVKVTNPTKVFAEVKSIFEKIVGLASKEQQGSSSKEIEELEDHVNDLTVRAAGGCTASHVAADSLINNGILNFTEEQSKSLENAARRYGGVTFESLTLMDEKKAVRQLLTYTSTNIKL